MIDNQTRFLIEAIENYRKVWKNEGKEPGWVKRVAEAEKLLQVAIDSIKALPLEFPLGTIVETTGESTYFKGTVVGHYTTLEGHEGCAVQVLDSDSAKRIVHVNRNKHLRKIS